MSERLRPSPKRVRTGPTPQSSPSKAPNTQHASPKKFSPRKYFAPRRFSPKKTTSPRKTASASGQSPAVKSEEGESVRGEAYYSTNFKEVLSKILLPSNPEHHVISEQEVALVDEFMRLEGWVWPNYYD